MARNDARSRNDDAEDLEMSPGSTIEDDDYDEFDAGVLTGFMNTVPPLPKIPGYHCAWVPIPSDIIQDRSRWMTMNMMGYEPITADEFAKYATKRMGRLIGPYRDRGGEFEGCVRVMDIVACKVPLSIRKKLDAALDRLNNDNDASLSERPRDFDYRAEVVDEHGNRGTGARFRKVEGKTYNDPTGLP